MRLDETDRLILAATQGGLPLVPQPFATIAENVGLDEATVLERFRAMQAAGIVRRIGAAPNHYKLGIVANGMTVWDVPDDEAERIGPEIGALEFVSHCYLRPRALPDWPYNLYAMVHGTDRDEVEAKRADIARRLGAACRGSAVLYSTRILKKTGLRLAKGSD